MKKIVKFAKVLPTHKPITIDMSAYSKNKFASIRDFVLIPCKNSLPHTITITGWTTLPSDLINVLSDLYSQGVTIIIDTYAFSCKRPKAKLRYEFVPFSLKAIPRGLAHQQLPSGKTFLETAKTVKGNYLPKEMWQTIDAYSQAKILEINEYNSIRWDVYEEFQKKLLHKLSDKGYTLYIPNKKALLEYQAEKTFINDIPQLLEGIRPLTETELEELYKDALAFGVEVPQVIYRYNYIKTRNGYAQCPERLFQFNAEDKLASTFYSKGDNAPKTIRQDAYVKFVENEALLREAYTTLVWLKKHNKNDRFIVTGYSRCSVCHQIYNENRGCEEIDLETGTPIVHIPPVEFLAKPNLFYSDCMSWEDYWESR